MSKKKSKNNDSGAYSNAVIGHGTKIDPMAKNKVRRTKLLTQQELNDLFVGDGVAALIVKIFPKEMLRAGFTLGDKVKENVQEKVFEFLADLDFNERTLEALTWARLFGGSAMVFGFKDGGTFTDPLNVKSISDIEFIRVYDRYELSESKRERDPTKVEFGKIIEWHINPTNGNSYNVHHSRMYLFDGDILPNKERNQNTDWGMSALQNCINQLTNLGVSHDYAVMMLQRMQQAVHGIKDLQAILDEPDGYKKVIKRLEAVDMARGILNTIVIDSEEQYTINTQALTGIKDLLTEFLGVLSAVSQIPVFILGRSVGGLNATGEREVEAWYAEIKSRQESKLAKFYLWAVSKVFAKMNRPNTKFEIKFNPLYLLDEKEEVDIEKTKAETNGKILSNIKSAVDVGYATREDCKESIMRALCLDKLELPKEIDYLEHPKDKAAAKAAKLKATAKPFGKGN